MHTFDAFIPREWREAPFVSYGECSAPFRSLIERLAGGRRVRAFAIGSSVTAEGGGCIWSGRARGALCL